MSVVDAFKQFPKETYTLKKYKEGVPNVMLLPDISGIRFSTGNLSFFQSLEAIVEPLQKMKIVTQAP